MLWSTIFGGKLLAENLLLGAVRRPSQHFASVFCYYCVCLPIHGILPWSIYQDIDQEGWILIIFGFFLLINSFSRLTLYRHIFAVKATIDMQSPHAKLLCLNISNEVEIFVVLKLAEDIKLLRK